MLYISACLQHLNLEVYVVMLEQIAYGTTENSPVTFCGFPVDNIERKAETVGCVSHHLEVHTQIFFFLHKIKFLVSGDLNFFLSFRQKWLILQQDTLFLLELQESLWSEATVSCWNIGKMKTKQKSVSLKIAGTKLGMCKFRVSLLIWHGRITKHQTIMKFK